MLYRDCSRISITQRNTPANLATVDQTDCEKTPACRPAKHHYDECVERVQAKEEGTHHGPKEDCVEECTFDPSYLFSSSLSTSLLFFTYHLFPCPPQTTDITYITNTSLLSPHSPHIVPSFPSPSSNKAPKSRMTIYTNTLTTSLPPHPLRDPMRRPQTLQAAQVKGPMHPINSDPIHARSTSINFSS